MAIQVSDLNFVTSDSGLLVPTVVANPLLGDGSADVTFDISPATADGWVLTSEAGIVGWAPPTGGGGGVDSIAKSGSSQLTGDVTLSGGSNITLTQVGQDISIAAASGGVTEIDYVAVTSDVSVTSTNSASPTNVINGSTLSYDGTTRVRIEVFIGNIVVGASNAETIVQLWEDTTDLLRLYYAFTTSGGNTYFPGGVVALFRTPTSGSHQYRVRAYRSGSNGTLSATGWAPMYLRITSGG